MDIHSKDPSHDLISSISKQAEVVVIMVPFPCQSHLNQLLHLSCLISSSYNIPVHYATTSTHLRQAKLRFNSQTHLQDSQIHFQEFPTPDVHSPSPTTDPSTKFPTHLQPSFDSSIHLRQPMAALLHKISATTRRVIIIHDVLMAYVVQDVANVPNAESYAFNPTSPFSSFFDGWQMMGKPSLEEPPPKGLPSFEGCFTIDVLTFIALQADFLKFTTGYIYNSSRSIEDKFFEFYADIPEEKEVKYAAHKLYGYVSTWWERLQSNRLRQYKQPIRTWPRMRRLISDRFLQSNRGQELYQEYRRKLKSKQMFRDNFDVQYSHVTADTNYSRNMPMSLTQLSFGSQKKNQVPSSSSQSFHNYYDGYEVAEEEGDRVEFSDKDEVGDEEEIGSAEDCLSVPTVEQQFDLDKGATKEVIVREDENISISYQVQELKGEESHELVHIISQHVNTISNIELCEPHGGIVFDKMPQNDSAKMEWHDSRICTLRATEGSIVFVSSWSNGGHSRQLDALKRNLDQLEALSKKLKAKTLRTEAPTQSIAATRLLAREGINAEQLARDLKSFELKVLLLYLKLHS
ncbi:hypothetical protein RHGRI_010538 [Rhododendron griersonianum]|uniref:Glycosyltransferase N-terminal domain-containing protein n=1 Tax=Rhododendron griersonianum TaxID=479676 RepID=A0AAV6KIW5_9ERIC|nr:hypothetical protein RHGRI_010538 [Rhododendron griersonianum]